MSAALLDGSRSRPLAEEICALDFHTLDERDQAQLQRLLLDHLACCYRGACLPWGQRLRQWAQQFAGSGQAGLFAAGCELSPAIAAFVNATAAHGLELDDTHDESVSHPGAPIIATALAVGRQQGCSGHDLLTAITAGYEVTGRVGAATNAARAIDMGFHPTALFAGFGATATAARLLGADAKQLAQAWGLMLSMAGGSMQFSQEPEGTTVKRLHGGYAALHGVLAAEHSLLGIAGPEQALDGRYGLLANFGDQQDPERLLRAHPDGPEIHRISFKPYPCCRLFHSTLDALAEVTDDFSLDPAEIAQLRVGGPEIMVSQHMLRRPESEMAAQYSLPFTLGAALYFGPRSVDGFMQEALQDPRILAIADLTEAELDPEMEAAFPKHYGSWLELETRSGERRRARVLDSLGTPARPLSLADLGEKFDSLVAPTGLPLRSEMLIRRLSELPQADDLEELLAPFLSAPPA
ncbi:MAG: MmgE/PrpD family protein [Gammaproteobacteria bacterium]|nr:MAG: MmgE/PrpD family protein [Gammaproteobacteria bacterium]